MDSIKAQPKQKTKHRRSAAILKPIWKDWISIIVEVLGAVITLSTFLIDYILPNVNPQTVRVTASICYLLIVGGALWIAFGARTLTPLLRSISLGGFAVVTGLFFLWVGTWINAARYEIIDGMDQVSVWNTYNGGQGSKLNISQEKSPWGGALRGDFTVGQFGYIGLAHQIDPQILAGSQAIGFKYKSSGEPNTIELKMIYLPKDGKEAVFSVMWNQATGNKGWTRLEVPYSRFACWDATGCEKNERLDISRVGRLDIAISNKAGDNLGSGTIWVDEIYVAP